MLGKVEVVKKGVGWLGLMDGVRKAGEEDGEGDGDM